MPEYEAVREVAAALAPEEWTTTEQRLLNRALSPILVLFLRRPAKHMDGDAGSGVGHGRAA